MDDSSETKNGDVTFERSPIGEAIRHEIVRLATEGDEKHGGDFTSAVAGRILNIATAARDLLIAAGGVGLSSKRRSKFNGFFDPDSGEESAIQIGPSFSNENFGMTALRELISIAKNFHDVPSKTVEALAVARREGLADVAAELEKRLGVSTSVPVEVVQEDSK